MIPLEYYRRLIETDQILPDEQQAAVISELQIVFNKLTQQTKTGLLNRFSLKKPPPISGLYLWGAVGRGKTFLMDCFYYCLPGNRKLRIHFFKFMQMIQQQLKMLQGKPNPLESIAKKLASEVSVICFDELLVNDIADAMLLTGLFKALYQQSICIIFTSNTAPDNLYLKGLQRESFLPAIALIKTHSKVIEITTDRDYRLKNFKENTFYYSPLNKATEAKLEQKFIQAAGLALVSQDPIILYGRHITIKKRTHNIMWLEFKDICGVPRCKDDYLAIAGQYKMLLISNLLQIKPEQNDLIRSFIELIDVLYDANTKLIISAETSIKQIYFCGRMLIEFARTRSRLIEMQTLTWHQK